MARRRPGLAAQRPLEVVLNPDSAPKEREAGYAALERLEGNRDNGREVFRRVCATCHRVGDRGYEFGPDQTDVGKRLTHREIIESIIEPSKKMDAKYITSTVITADGRALVGFVKEKTDQSLTLLMLAIPAGVAGVARAAADADAATRTKMAKAACRCAASTRFRTSSVAAR